MSTATIHHTEHTVRKVYRARELDRLEREVYAYTNLGWATPKLIGHGRDWIETERLTPILKLPKPKSRRYREPLRDLLQRLHEAGWWHRDVALVNVVIHPTRGPLLIDWEHLERATASVSVDLHGAHHAGVNPTNNGVWWGGPWLECPGPYWDNTP